MLVTFILILLIIGNAILFWGLQRLRSVCPTLLLGLIVHWFCYGAYPVIFVLFSPEIIRESHFAEFLELTFWQQGSTLLTGVILLRVGNTSRPFESRGDLAVNENIALRFLLIVWVVSVALVLGDKRETFLEQNHGILTGETGSGGVSDFLMMALFSVSAALIIRNPLDSTLLSMRLCAISWGIVITQTVLMIGKGMRIALGIVPFLLVADLLGRKNLREQRLRLGILAATMVVAGFTLPPLAASLGHVRDRNEAVTGDAIVDGFAEVFSAGSTIDAMTLFLDGFYVKFAALEYGAALIATEGSGGGGWQPIISAALAPVPRAIWPEKPVPGSKSDDYLGIPYRIAAQDYGKVELGMVVPVAGVAVAKWELGYGGIVLFIILNMISLKGVDFLLRSNSIVHNAFGITMMSIPSCEFLVAGPSELVKNWVRILTCVFVFHGAIAVRNHLKKKVGRMY